MARSMCTSNFLFAHAMIIQSTLAESILILLQNNLLEHVASSICQTVIISHQLQLMHFGTQRGEWIGKGRNI